MRPIIPASRWRPVRTSIVLPHRIFLRDRLRRRKANLSSRSKRTNLVIQRNGSGSYLMQKRIWKVITAVLLVTGSATLVQAQTPLSTAVPFLLIAPDARAAGMGDAGVAVA